jgi:hypothetical protein
VDDPIGSGMDGDCFCLVYPYIDGIDLTALLMAAGGALPLPRTMRILADLADGLGAIHAKGVVHRDIKTDNIIIDSGGAARIIDLGIARIIRQRTLTAGKGILGSPSTMAPEQFADPTSVDGRADVYSAGVVLFEMLTGKAPFPMTGDGDVGRAVRVRRPIPPSRWNSAVPDELDGLCVKMLAPDPRDRVQTAAELRAACRSIATRLGVGPGRSGVGVTVRPVPTGPRCLACGVPTQGAPACPGCGREFGKVRHSLTLRSGPAAGEVLEAPQGSYIAGRAQIAPIDAHMSRRQLHIACSNGRLLIADGGGANPTLLENRPIPVPEAMQPGANVRLGVSWAKYLRT